MSISYDTLSAYYDKASRDIEKQSKEAVKAIADTALASLSEGQNNANYDNAVSAAYRQMQTPQPAETLNYRQNANKENIAYGLRNSQNEVNRNLDALKGITKAENEVNLATISAKMGNSRADNELALANSRIAQDNALRQAEETRKAQEGVMDSLNKLSADNGYNYDFDADIFALEQQGLTSKDWQIQYLQEAKRLQSRNRQALKQSAKKNEGEVESLSPMGGDIPSTTGEKIQNRYQLLNEQIGKYLMTSAGAGQRENLVNKIEQEYKSGNITEEQAKKLAEMVVA